ncbi:MAG TPA: aldose epimerase family protein [Polyangiaceae bacterium]|nr:aldose epimerase family protein [Polyangiaceae bacterium]
MNALALPRLGVFGAPKRALVFSALVAWACSGKTVSEPPPAMPAAAAAEPAVPAPVAPAENQSEPASPMITSPSPITRSDFGSIDGKAVDLYTLTNQNGAILKVTTYGAIVTELHVPDRDGNLADVVLGFDTLDGYLKHNVFLGATVGRVANRIRGAKFKLDGKEYTVAANDGPHHLHGGVRGWDKVVWTAEPQPGPDGPALRLTYVSPDGEEGYPGTVTATTIYTLTHGNELRVDMEATTDAPTLVNMAHHSYWNLGGHDSGAITEHELELYADEYTPGDPMVPTGAIKAVKGTPLDFLVKKPIGRDLAAVGGKPAGYDHNFVVKGDPNSLRPVARLSHPKSGRVLQIEANQPGVQLYTGNFLDGSARGKGGAVYAQYGGLCLETQKFPNAINVPAWREQVILRPGQTYRHTMVHRFSVE